MTKQEAANAIMTEIRKTTIARDACVEIQNSYGLSLQLQLQAQLDGLKIALYYVKAIDE